MIYKAFFFSFFSKNTGDFYFEALTYASITHLKAMEISTNVCFTSELQKY